MNLIYIRPKAARARKFIKSKLRGDEAVSIYDIEAGDCCLAPAPVKRRNLLFTFLNDASPEMLDFFRRNNALAQGRHN